MIGRLEQLLAAATPEPWKWRKDGSLRGFDGNAIINPTLLGRKPLRECVNYDADADAIAAIPDLLAVVRAAQRVCAEREGHVLGSESPLYVKLLGLDEALAAFEEGGKP